MTTLTLPVFETRGGLKAMMDSTEREQGLEGPRGTGKTWGICWWEDYLLLKYPESKGLMLRKTLTALTRGALATFTAHVWDPNLAKFYGGSQKEPAGYRYKNGSTLAVMGLDDPDKALSSEYDFIYVNEGTELSEGEWTALRPLLRNGKMPHPRLVTDFNPTHDRHHLYERERQGLITIHKSKLEDNPGFFDTEGNITAKGTAYIADLDTLTGSLYRRWRLGERVGVENAIYNVEHGRHFSPRWPLPDCTWVAGAIGLDYGEGTPTSHPYSLVAITADEGNHAWVRETWIGHDFDDLVRNLGRMMGEYHIKKVRVDPMLKGWDRPERGTNSIVGVPVKRADGSPGSRKNRIERVTRRLNADTLRLDPDPSKNNQVLFDEMLAYRWDVKETDLKIERAPVRKDEDAVAAMEYALEEIDLNALPALESAGRWDRPRGGSIEGFRSW